MTKKSAARQFWCSSLGLVFVLAMTAANVGAASTLDALWHMDGSAATVTDSSGNANTGAGTNTVSTGGKFNSSLRFNGTTAYVSAPDSATLEQTSDFTVEAWIWINPASSPYEHDIVAKWDNQVDTTPESDGYLLAINEGVLAGVITMDGTFNTYSSVTGNTVVSTGVWHHVAMVFNHAGISVCSPSKIKTSECAPTGLEAAPTLSLYLDGVLDAVAGASYSSIWPATGIPVTIGARNDNSPSDLTTDYDSFFYGNIDEVRIWGRVLASNEILASAQSGLRGDWHFDVASTGGVTPDSSGYSNNATLSGGAGMVGGTGPATWFGKSLQLSGSNWATVADNSTVEIAGSLSLDAWINPTSVSPEIQIIAGRLYYEDVAYVLYLNYNDLCMQYGENSACSEPVVTAGTWQHAAGVVDFNAGNIYAYLNGVQVAMTPTSGPVPLDPGVKLSIGTDPAGSSEFIYTFTGAIDEVHLWARALSAAEVGFISGNCGGAVSVGRPRVPGPSCSAELIVPLDMTQKIGTSDAEVVPETYFQYEATSEALPPPVKPTSKPSPGGLPEHAMPLWFMVSDPDTTTASPSNPCAIDIGSTPGDPKYQIGGFLGCQASADGKSALISGDQINVQTSAKKPPQPATTLHLEVTTSDSDELPVNIQWR